MEPTPCNSKLVLELIVVINYNGRGTKDLKKKKRYLPIFFFLVEVCVGPELEVLNTHTIQCSVSP